MGRQTISCDPAAGRGSRSARDDKHAAERYPGPPRRLLSALKMDLPLFARKFLCQPREDVRENLFRRRFWR